MQKNPVLRFCVCAMGLAFVLVAMRSPIALGDLLRMEKASEKEFAQDEDDLNGGKTVDGELFISDNSAGASWSPSSGLCALAVAGHEQSPFAGLWRASTCLPPRSICSLSRLISLHFA